MCACSVASVVSDCFVTPWTVAPQAAPSMGFSRQGYWSRLPCPPPGDLPDPGIELSSLKSAALAGGLFTTWEAPRWVPREALTWPVSWWETQTRRGKRAPGSQSQGVGRRCCRLRVNEGEAAARSREEGVGAPPLLYRPARPSNGDVWPPELPENPVLLLPSTQFVAPCSDRPSKPIQTHIPERPCKENKEQYHHHFRELPFIWKYDIVTCDSPWTRVT